MGQPTVSLEGFGEKGRRDDGVMMIMGPLEDSYHKSPLTANV